MLCRPYSSRLDRQPGGGLVPSWSPDGRRTRCGSCAKGPARCPLSTRRLRAKPSAGAAMGAHGLQRMAPAAEHERGATPEPKVPSFERVPRLHGDVAVAEIQVHAEPRRQPLLPDAGRQDQRGFRAARVVVLGYGPQTVVEGAPAQGQALADDPEAAAIVECDGGVEPAPVVELHVRPKRGVQVSTHPSEKKVILSVKMSETPEEWAHAALDREAVNVLIDRLEFHRHMAETRS